jgi:hypothetical protein
MSIKSKVPSRALALFAAFALLAGTFVPLAQQSSVSADQLTSRRIKMSDSTPGATTGVQYELTFTTGALVGTTNEIVVDFCSDTPLLGATCAFVTGTSIPSFTAPTVSTGAISATNNRTLVITGLTINQNASYTITVTGGITNPSAVNASFYARVFTYTTGNASGYTQAAATGGSPVLGSYVDFGGIALNTVAQVTITARVMESLTFCASGTNLDGNAVVGADASDSCAEATPPDLEIGQGTPLILDASRVDATSAYTQISTNATSGAIIRMKATNTCANSGLSNTGGAACNIPGLADGTFTNGESPMALPAGTAAFGLFVGLSAPTEAVPSSTGTVAPDANYYDAAHDTGGEGFWYGMDRRNTTDGVRSTYGDVIAASTAPVSQINNELKFAATPSLTTPAGIYTGNEILIATGTF